MKNLGTIVLSFVIGAVGTYGLLAIGASPESQDVTLGARNTTYIKNPHVFEDTVTLRGNTTLGNATSDTFTVAGTLTFDYAPVYSSVLATSSAGTVAYTAANITGITSLLHDATGAVTASLPASSTLSSFVPSTGDRVSIGIVNVGTANLTLAGGTGTSLNTASTSRVILPGGSGVLDFVRKANTDIEVFFDHGI